MSYLVEKNGERQHVVSLDGYEDWTVLAEGANSRPVDHADWNPTAKRWVVNPGLQAAAMRVAAANAMSRAELLARIEALEARLAAAGIP
jgi:hypothetical protein